MASILMRRMNWSCSRGMAARAENPDGTQDRLAMAAASGFTKLGTTFSEASSSATSNKASTASAGAAVIGAKHTSLVVRPHARRPPHRPVTGTASPTRRSASVAGLPLTVIVQVSGIAPSN